MLLLVLFYACTPSSSSTQQPESQLDVEKDSTPPIEKISFFLPEGATIAERFKLPPTGFHRVTPTPNSFASYLQNFPLKPHGAQVHYYDGNVKPNHNVYLAVLDIDVGDRDLQQCADAVMRLKAEYHYQLEEYDQIRFNLTNGFPVDYSSWRAGKRVAVEGNRTWWVDRAGYNDSYQTFRKYLTFVFSYAGTLSLEKELTPVAMKDIEIGDVLIRGGSPGHAVIVVDMAINEATGEKKFMLAQSYMPAQEIQILQNPQAEKGNPWYSNLVEGTFYTPEWTFTTGQLRRF